MKVRQAGSRSFGSALLAATKFRAGRRAILVLALAFAAFTPALAHLGPGFGWEQEAAPQPSDAQASADPMAGVTTEALGSLPSAGAPGYTLVFLRITMQPGANIPAHSHPGDVAVVVQSGRFGTSFVRGQGTITRATTGMAAPAAETLKAGDSAVLLPGDSLTYSGSAGHNMSNAGDTPLVLLVSALLATGQSGFMFDH
jgi:mannose-6-phosphate isomerase-like protein (cupin superfamily)